MEWYSVCRPLSWLISLSTIFSRSINPAANGNILFTFIYCIIIVFISRLSAGPLSIISLKSGSGRFRALAIVSDTAMATGLQISFQDVCFVSSGYIPRIQTAIYMSALFLIFAEPPNCFRVASPVSISANSAQRFPFLQHHCQHFSPFAFDNIHSNGSEAIAYCGYYAFPWWLAILSTFCTCQLLYIFEIMSILVLCHFILWLFESLLLTCKNSLYI